MLSLSLTAAQYGVQNAPVLINNLQFVQVTLIALSVISHQC